MIPGNIVTHLVSLKTRSVASELDANRDPDLLQIKRNYSAKIETASLRISRDIARSSKQLGGTLGVSLSGRHNRSKAEFPLFLKWGKLGDFHGPSLGQARTSRSGFDI